MEIRKAHRSPLVSTPEAWANAAVPRLEAEPEARPFGRDQTSLTPSRSRAAAPSANPGPDPKRTIAEAERLARRVLARDTHRVTEPGHKRPLAVLTAGSANYEALFTRDACFGSLGLLEPGKPAPAVRDSLQAMLDRMLPTGEMPRRQGEHGDAWLMTASALHLHLPDLHRLDKVDYTHPRGVYQFDCNALPLVVAAEYVRATGDVGFIHKNYARLTQAADWLESMDTSRLIDQPPSADWKDVTGRRGVTAYTNAVAYEAHQSMAAIDRLMGNTARAEQREQLAARIKHDFNRRLWDPKRGIYKDSENTDIFSPDGNILAVIFGLADKSQTESIFKQLQSMAQQHPLPFPAADHAYPAGYIPIWLKLAGMEHYQDTMVWPWQGAAFAAAAARAGHVELARQVLTEVGAAAVKAGTFYEVYTPDAHPKPVSTWLYHSEPDFLWSAGTYLWAARELRQAEARTGPG